MRDRLWWWWMRSRHVFKHSVLCRFFGHQFMPAHHGLSDKMLLVCRRCWLAYEWDHATKSLVRWE